MIEFSEDEVRLQLARILKSSVFTRSQRLSRFLQFIVDLFLAGRAEELKEYTIGASVFDRGRNFDPRVDTIVRTQAHRLRTALASFYANEGREDPIVISIEKGSYVPSIRPNRPEPSAATTAEPAPQRLGGSERRWAVALTVIAIAFIAGAVLSRLFSQSATVEARPTHLALPLLAEGVLDLSNGPAVISPAGSRVLFPLIEPSGVRRLWLRPLGSVKAIPLAGTEDGIHPFWSPDESEIGFFGGGKLKVYRLKDGSIRELCDAPLGRGGTWNRDGVILFSPAAVASRVYRTTPAGTPPVPVTKLDTSRAEADHRWPAFLSDGRHFVYTVHSRERSNDGVYLGSLDNAPPVRLAPVLSQASSVTVSGKEYLVYMKDKAIRARRLDLRGARLDGQEISLVDGVSYDPSRGACFSLAGALYLTYQSTRSHQSLPVQVDRSGRLIRNLAVRGNYESLVVSHDGRRIAFEVAASEQDKGDIWVSDLDQISLVRVTYDGAEHAVWGTAGRSILFVTPSDSFSSIHRRSLVEGDKQVIAHRSPYIMVPTDLSRDGRYLAYHEFGPESQTDLWLLPVNSEAGAASGEAIALRRSRFNEQRARFSPDCRYVAYVSNESGRAEIYVEMVPGQSGQGQRWKISSAGGSHPLWRPDGRELFYLSQQRTVMSVAITTSAQGVKFKAPQQLFTATSPLSGVRKSPWGVSASGQSFYMLVNPAEPGPVQVSVISDWASLLDKQNQ